jgi:hypothetical protein
VRDGKAFLEKPGVINTVGTNFLTAGQPVKLGKNTNNNAEFMGQIDRVEVYSPAPTAAQFVEYAARTDAKLASAPELYWMWSLAEGMGTTTTETKTNTTATLNGATWDLGGVTCGP